MGKHTTLKRPQQAAAPRKTTPSSLFARTEQLLDDMVASFETTIRSGRANPTLTREAAGLARAVATIDGARRAREKQDREATRSLQLPQVMAFLRQLEPERRAHILRELQAMDSSGSVLA